MRRVTQINNLVSRNMITHHYNQRRMLFGGPTRMLQCAQISNIKSALAKVANDELPAMNNRVIKSEKNIETLNQEVSALADEVERLIQLVMTNNEQFQTVLNEVIEVTRDFSKLSRQQKSNKDACEQLNKKLNAEVASRKRGEKKLASDLSKLSQAQKCSNDVYNSERMMLVPWDLKKKESWSEPFSLWGHTWKLGMEQCSPTKWELILTAADDSKWAAPVTFKIKKANRDTRTIEGEGDLASRFSWARACNELSSDDYDTYAHDGRLAVHIEMFSPPRFEAFLGAFQALSLVHFSPSPAAYFCSFSKHEKKYILYVSLFKEILPARV